MKILHVSPGLQETCGVSNFIVESSRALQALGHQVCIVTTMTCGYPADDLDIRLLEDPRQVDFSPDIVHIHTLWSPYVHKAAGWCRRNRLPYIVSPHGSLTPWALRHKWWKKVPALLMYQYYDLLRADAFHVTTAPEAENLRHLFLQQAVHIAPLGVHSLPERKSQAAYSGNIHNILFLGRIHPVKGLENLLQAWQILKDKMLTEAGSGWRLLIAGPNDIGYQEELLELAVRSGLKVEDWRDRLSCGKKNMTGGSEVGVEEFSRHLAGSQAELIFTGPVYHQAKDFFYSIADLFVLPSYSENFGVVVVDALAHGVPVITTKGTPWQELTGSDAGGRCGWWIEIGAKPLANALAEAMSMPDENRTALGDNGRKLVAEKYTWSAVGKKLAQGYQLVLKKH